MIAYCDVCKRATESYKSGCPDCGRGINLDFDHGLDYFLNQGYKEYKNSWERTEEKSEKKEESAENRNRILTADNNIVFNDNFANFCGTSAIEDAGKEGERFFSFESENNSNGEKRVSFIPRADGTKTSSLHKINPDSDTSDNTSNGAFVFQIDSNASDSLRSRGDFSRDTEQSFSGSSSYGIGNSDEIAALLKQAASPDSSSSENGDFFADNTRNTPSHRTSSDSQNGSRTNRSDYIDEYERQRRQALARERRQAFLDRLRMINPRTVFRIVAVVAVIGLVAYIWTMRYVILESITNFFISLVPYIVIFVLIYIGIRSLLRRR